MTLALALQTDRFTALVGETRVTVDGHEPDDHYVKCGYIHTSDARFVYSLTGFAGEADLKWSTATWLHEAIPRNARPDYRCEPLIARLAADLAGTLCAPRFEEIPDEKFDSVGIGYFGFVGPMGRERAFHGSSASGIEREHGKRVPRSKYELHIRNIGAASAAAVGRWNAPGLEEQLKRVDALLVKSPDSITPALRKAIHVIRRAASQDGAGKIVSKIGRNVSIIELEANNPNPRAEYRADEVSNQVYVPPVFFVRAEGDHGCVRLEIEKVPTPDHPDPAYLPEQHPSARCACGSGKRRRDCHG
jgi:hypothetical protein